VSPAAAQLPAGARSTAPSPPARTSSGSEPSGERLLLRTPPMGPWATEVNGWQPRLGVAIATSGRGTPASYVDVGSGQACHGSHPPSSARQSSVHFASAESYVQVRLGGPYIVPAESMYSLRHGAHKRIQPLLRCSLMLMRLIRTSVQRGS